MILISGSWRTGRGIHQPIGFHLSAIRFQFRCTLEDCENTRTHLKPTQSNIEPVPANRENARAHLKPIQSLFQPIQTGSQTVVRNLQIVF
jgi:hypothetical protein